MLTSHHLHAALIPPVVMEGESLESVSSTTSGAISPATEPTRQTYAIAGERSRGLDYLSRGNRLVRSLKLRLYAASVCSTLTHGSEAWMLTLNGFSSRQIHHREVVSRGGHQSFVRPSDGCANAEASVAGPYPADACRPPIAPCGVGAGPTIWTVGAVPTWQPPDGHTPPPK